MILEPEIKSREIKRLFEAITLLKNKREVAAFFRDIFTLEELVEASHRLEVAQMLDKKINFKTIEQKTGVSSATISRINHWLKHGMGGYQLILKRFKKII